jgi:hypothetical protein
MHRLPDLKFLRLISFSALLLSVPAFAQFEIAPDHFDSNEHKVATTHQSTAKGRATNGLHAKPGVVSHPPAGAAATTARHKQH